MFTDIEGSTRLWEQHPEAMGVALRRHDELLRSAIESSSGYVFKTVGDAFCAAFAAAQDALEAAARAQAALQAEPWPEEAGLAVRMALHTGQCEERDGDYFGPTVNRAARLEATAHGGQVVLSQATAVMVRDTLPEGLELEDLGSHRLKDLERPEQVFSLRMEGLAQEFPPLRSLDNPALPNNLPAQSDHFIGRVREVAEVRDLVDGNRLVTLTGAGGSGKTRLALQVAADLLDGSGDGVWLVELAPVSDEDRVAATVNAVLGIAPQPGRPELDTLVDALEPQRLLIMLDNCEHLIGACAKACDAVLRRCPGVHLLVTSREPLGIGGETIYRVPSLSVPDGETGPDGTGPDPGVSDAVALFLDRARAQGATVSLDATTGPLLASICRRLDGMPLAIELAAARLRSMSVATIHDRLDQRFRLLTGGSRSALPRQQTLRATVEWSYSLLTGPEQAVLRRLSVFVEGFDLEAAEAVCALDDTDPFDVADMVGSLVDKSLVVADPLGTGVRYRFLQTIRQFGAEHLVEQGGDEAADVAAAHCSYYLSVAEEAAPHLPGADQARWTARLRTDDANIQRAVEHAVEDADEGGTARALRFAVALRRYWWGRIRAGDTVLRLMPVLERPEAATTPELLGRAMVSVLDALGPLGHVDAARLGEQAVQLVRPLGDDRLLMEALGSLSLVYGVVGEDARGLALTEEAVALARGLGDDLAVAMALGVHLFAAVSRGDFDAAEADALFAEAIARAERSGDLFTLSTITNNAGCHALQVGNLPAARTWFERSLQVCDVLGIDRVNGLINLGWVIREEHGSGAAGRFGEALVLGRRSGDRMATAYACLGLACSAGDESRWHRAASLHGVAQALIDQVGSPWWEPEVRYRQASLDIIGEHLTGPELELALADGRSLSFDQMVDLALGRSRPG